MIDYKLFKNNQNKYKITTDGTSSVAGYSQIVSPSPQEWIKACKSKEVNKDYKFMRHILKQTWGELGDTEWNALPQNTKFLVCTMKATLLERCRDELGVKMDYWTSDFDTESVKARRLRMSKAKAMMLNNLEAESCFMLWKTIVEVDKLDTSYIENGLEGTQDGDILEGLFNFLHSTPLSYYGGLTHDPLGNALGRYETIGFTTNPNIVVLERSNLTIVELRDKILNCLKYGIYE